jgi:hypothetical protein
MPGSPRAQIVRLCLLSVAMALILTPAARADTLTVDFDSSPPAVGETIEQQYLASAFVTFAKSDAGFTPARRAAPDGLAHSGGFAADVGADRCGPDGNGGADCELPIGGTIGHMTKSADSVTLWAGLFTPVTGTVYAELVGRDINGVQVGTSGKVAIGVGFHTPVTVTSATPNIVRFDLQISDNGTDSAARGAEVGFDDLTFSYPPGTLADVALSAPVATATAPEGGSVDVPVSIARINGSNGPLNMSVAGLPPGVTATVVPNPVPGTQSTAMVHVTASANAQPFFSPIDVTVVADPAGNGSVAQGLRSTTFPLVVRSPYDLKRDDTGTVAIPECAPRDVPLELDRDAAFSTSKTAVLSVDGLPPGVTAQLLPGQTVPPGGGFNANFTLRLTRPSTTVIPFNTTITVEAQALDAPTRTLTIPIAAAPQTAAFDATTTSGSVPERLQPGSTVRLSGNGFCAGTRVQVGNGLAITGTTVDADNRGLTFQVPRLATSGTVSVITPGGANNPVPGTFTVRSFRDYSGFQFDNPGWGNLSFDEITDLFGTEEMFLSTNPCWPLGDCTIALPIPDPIAYLKWQIIEQVVKGSGGHCFGINRTMQEINAGRIHTSDFQAGATHGYSLGSPSGPNGALGSYLDQRHAGQASAEFLLTYGSRDDSISAQLGRLRSELAAGRLPGIVMKPSITKGHVVTATDIETLPDGSTLIHLYDNEQPFLPAEDSDRTGAAHKHQEDLSSITINPAKTHWDYGGGWSGGNDGSLYVTKLTDWPAGTAPTLPGLIDAAIGVFGSTGGAAVTGPQQPGTEVVPVFDKSAIPGANGFVLGKGGESSITHSMDGKKDGSYSQTVMGNDFIGGVMGVPTSKGVNDRVSGSIAAHTIDFAGQKNRPLNLQVGLHKKRSSRLATFSTHTFKGAGDTAQMQAGSVVYDHSGPGTTFSFSIESVQAGASAAEFKSGPLRVGPGEQVTVAPTSWSSLKGVRLSIGKPGGHKRVRMLRNRVPGNGARIAISRLALRTIRGHRTATVTARLRRVPADSAQGVVLRLTGRNRVYALKSFGVRRARNGTRTFSWRLPRVAKGAYRLVADVTVAASGAHPGTARRTRRAAVRVR